jgi:hypothetical protein
MTDRDTSMAYQALSPARRKVLAVIEDEIARCGGGVAISHTDLKRLSGLLSGTTGFETACDARLRHHQARTAPEAHQHIPADRWLA